MNSSTLLFSDVPPILRLELKLIYVQYVYSYDHLILLIYYAICIFLKVKMLVKFLVDLDIACYIISYHYLLYVPWKT